MKKIGWILCLLFVCIENNVTAQIWATPYIPYSIPQSDFTADGTIYATNTDGEILETKEEDIFTEFTDPTSGIGININYMTDAKYTVGLDMSYVEYKSSTDFFSTQMFRIGPSIDRFFLGEKKVTPYIGAQFGMQQVLVKINREIIDQPRLSRTDFSIGARAGLRYKIVDRVSLDFNARYVYAVLRPYIDLSAGISVNIGDF